MNLGEFSLVDKIDPHNGTKYDYNLSSELANKFNIEEWKE